jgi:hypothetical protein
LPLDEALPIARQFAVPTDPLSRTFDFRLSTFEFLTF